MFGYFLFLGTTAKQKYDNVFNMYWHKFNIWSYNTFNQNTAYYKVYH
jgi:hypothetical protein